MGQRSGNLEVQKEQTRGSTFLWRRGRGLAPAAPSPSRRGRVSWGPRTGARLRTGTLTLTAAARPKGWLSGGSRAPTHAHSARVPRRWEGRERGKGEGGKRKEVEKRGRSWHEPGVYPQLCGHFLLLLGNRKCP